MSNDTAYQRLTHAAQERAAEGFLEVIRRAVLDDQRSAVEPQAVTLARYTLRQDLNVFLQRVDRLYRAALERAFQTMYVDLRADLRKRSIDELTLVDDEVMSHQIEIGRLTARMRESSEEHIGRLNVIIAQLHGRHDARERENPFRPYLLARALYDAARQTARDEAQAKGLFDFLSATMVRYLPGYYGELREMFEAYGVHGRLEVQRAGSEQPRQFDVPALRDEPVRTPEPAPDPMRVPTQPPDPLGVPTQLVDPLRMPTMPWQGGPATGIGDPFAEMAKALREILQTMKVDPRLSSFLLHVWPRVLVSAAAQDSVNDVVPGSAGSLFERYRAVLPELLWSVRRKSTEERLVLMRLLPDLVKRLNEALRLIDLPADECRAINDYLVALHTAVLRAAPVENGSGPDLGSLRTTFSGLSPP